MAPLFEILILALEKVWITFTHNWPFLVISILISVALRLYIHPEKVSAILTRYRRVGVIGATAAAVATPFCSCGTTAVILGMMASTTPWAPIVAFMVASPLTSPEELVYSAGLFGWRFAIAFFVSSILLGLLGGLVAEIFETGGWLTNQTRFRQTPAIAGNSLTLVNGSQAKSTTNCACQPIRQHGIIHDIRLNRPVIAMELASNTTACCGPTVEETYPSDCRCSSGITKNLSTAYRCGDQEAETRYSQQVKTFQTVTLRHWIDELYRTGKQLIVMFLGFAFIGYILNSLIPPAWIASVFGPGHTYSVPLAAILGLPLYINTEGSLPLVRTLIDGGMSQGAALAFLITGAGTSFGAIAGALTIARWRVIALVILTLWIGAVVLGFTYDLLLGAHLI